MVEYGVNVANKFGFLSDDESEDPEVVLKRAEAASKKDEKSASQKKADKNAAARKRKENLAAQNAARDGLKKTTNLPQKKIPDEGQVRGRGRGRPGRGRGNFGRGGEHMERSERFERDNDTMQKDSFGDRFGENMAPRGRGRGRGGRGGPRSFRGGRGAPRQLAEGDRSGDENNETVLHMDREVDNAGGFPPRSGFRGGRGYRGGDRVFRSGRGRRQFDRFERSQEKQENNENSEVREGAEGATNELVNHNGEEKVDENALPVREKTEEELRAEAEAEELAKQITLDEFKAQMAAKRQEPQFNTRKAGEGSNEKEFGKLVPLAKDIIQDAPEEEIVVVRREPRTKRLDIEINFTDEQRSGRGGRGGFRGGRGYRGGRSENRGSRRHDENFEMWANDFPALGAGTH